MICEGREKSIFQELFTLRDDSLLKNYFEIFSFIKKEFYFEIDKFLM